MTINHNEATMSKKLMRCIYCGLLQDEPKGIKECQRCGGELAFEDLRSTIDAGSYLRTQLELDQVQAPSGKNVDRYLLVTLETPPAVPPEQSAPQKSGRAPMNFAVVLDVSGSMQGEKLTQAKRAVQLSLHHLLDGDTISMVTFSSDVRTVLEPKTVSQDACRLVESLLKEINATGMTALDGGLEKGIEKALRKMQDNNLVMLLSDGQANVGETDLEMIGQRALAGRRRGLVISSLGIGADYNEALMAEIASQGGGRFYHLQEAQQIPAYLSGELGEAANIAARKTVLEINLPPGAALIPLSSAYPAEQEGLIVRVSIGDIPCGLELEVPLRLTLFAQKEGARLRVGGGVEYISPAGNRLSSTLNQVTVRFVSSSEFQLRQGVAAPVVEKVIQYRQAAYVLGITRTRSRSVEDAQIQASREAQSLREYAALLGEEEIEKMDQDLGDRLNILAASPSLAKSRVSDAHAFVRKARKFDP
jgi:Ca-activated chloride channel homolog